MYICSCMHRNLPLGHTYYTMCVERLGTTNQKHKCVEFSKKYAREWHHITVSVWTASREAQEYNPFEIEETTQQSRFNGTQQVRVPTSFRMCSTYLPEPAADEA